MYADRAASGFPETWLFRTDADHEIGLGHLRRTLSLAQQAKEFGIEPIFILKHCDASALTFLSSFQCRAISIPSWFTLSEERRWTDEAIESYEATVLVLDISHKKTPEDPAELRNYLRRRQGVTTCAIDGIGKTQLLDSESDLVDLLVVPYLGAPDPEPERGLLFGPKYAVFDNGILHCAEEPPSVVEQRSLRLLITAGGSDPYGVTELALGAVLHEPECGDLELRVVFGALFAKERQTQLRANNTRGQKITWIDAPSSLCRELSWADVVISATGLTKYEITLFGVPAIFISGDRDQFDANRHFAARETGIHLGPIRNVSRSDVANALRELISSPNLRASMSQRSRSLLDGRGSNRIVSAIRHEREIRNVT